MRRGVILSLSILLAGNLSCSKPVDEIRYDNPLDPAGISYTSNIPDPPVVTGTTPTDDTTPTWNWTAVTGAAKYRYGFAEGAWITETAAETSYTPASALPYGTYTLSVQAGNDTGKWSASGNFAITINQLASPTPEINIKQDTVNIASGGSHDLGSVTSGSSGTPVVFTIENTGTGDLSITGVTSNDQSQFTVNTTGMNSTVTAGGSATFTVTFNPSSSGSKNAVLTISNNDSDEGNYSVQLAGTGNQVTSAAPEINIKQGAANIRNKRIYNSFPECY